MTNLSSQARLIVQATIATISGLFITAAVVFGVIALAFAGLLIGFAGALVAQIKPPKRHAIVTLHARRTGRGWSVDPHQR